MSLRDLHIYIQIINVFVVLKVNIEILLIALIFRYLHFFIFSTFTFSKFTHF
jgi:hypothetical protein